MVLAFGAPAARAAPQLVENENGDGAVVSDVLSQSRLLGSTATGPGGVFDPPTVLTRSRVLEGPAVDVDAGGGAVTAWLAGDSVVYASIAPPGGGFGPPVALGDGLESDAVTVDVNPRGDALVLWRRMGQPTYAIRPAGGSFGPPATVPQADRAVLEADGGVLFLGGASELRTTYRRPDGTLEPPVDVDGAPGASDFSAAIASDRRGDVLFAWADSDGVKLRERPAGGSFGPMQQIAALRPRVGVSTVSAALDDSGSAALAVRADGLWALSRSEGGAWAAPRRVASDPTTYRTAIDERGDAALIWTGDGPGLYGSYRPAGGSFGPRAKLAGRPPSFPWSRLPFPRPSLAIDGAGVATAAWEDGDGESITVWARRFGAPGAGTAKALLTVPSFVQEAPPETCTPDAATVVARNSRAVLTRRASAGLAGCLLARGRSIDLPRADFGLQYPYGVRGGLVQSPPAPLLRGPLVAVVMRDTVSEMNQDGTETGHENTYVTITDLRDEVSGRNRVSLATGGGRASVPVLRLRSDAAAAWVACAPGRGRCSRSGKRRKLVYTFGLGRDHPALVGKGKRIVPSSLRLKGTHVSWRDGKHRRSARLG